MRDSSPDDKPLTGRLEGLALPDLLWVLSGGGKTGTLHVSSDSRCKTLYLQDGQIVFAASNDPDERLGTLLLRNGRVSLDDLDSAVRRLQSGKRIGTIMVEAGNLAPEQLVGAVLEQVRGIALELFTWEEGEYLFEEGPLPTDELITLNIGTNELLLQGIRRVRSMGRIRRSVGGGRTVYGLADGYEDVLAGLNLGEGEMELIDRLRNGEESVENLCREVFLSNFEIYQTLWALKVVGVIEERDVYVESLSRATFEGRFERDGFAELMVRLCRAGETGVLHVNRRSRERTFHLRQGQLVFATSNDPDDGLLTFLLRRGVISLRDREETSRRLLSNKRVGTILLEMGVLDDEDLREMVRQQLTEIISDTFLWEHADYAMLSGPLPSTEEIVIDADYQEIISAGIRRVVSWARVIRGCGGLDSVLSLTPEYLDVLDAMRAGVEEWEVATALKTPRTPQEVCRMTQIGDFRVCQILWTLRALGALEALPVGRLDEECEEAPAPAIEAPESVESTVAERGAQVPAEEEPAALVESYEAPGIADVPRHDPEPQVEILEVSAVDEPEPPSEIPIRIEASADEAPRQTQALSLEEVEAALSAPPADEDERSEPADSVAPAEEQVAAENEPSIWEMERASRTTRLSREEVEAALAQPEEEDGEPAGIDDGSMAEPPEEPVADEPAVELVVPDDWDPPEDLDRAIARFNAMQRVVFRTVRLEVGAGAANFVRSCCDPDSPESVDLLHGAEMLADGTWDSEGLRRAIFQQRVEDPWSEYQSLIDREIEVLRGHIGDARTVQLEDLVREADPGSA